VAEQRKHFCFVLLAENKVIMGGLAGSFAKHSRKAMINEDIAKIASIAKSGDWARLAQKKNGSPVRLPFSSDEGGAQRRFAKKLIARSRSQ
jgi:hypothetical protein